MSEEKNKEAVKYFQKRIINRLPEMRAAKERGLFPKKEGWRIVVEHEIIEAEACDVLAEALNLSPKIRDNLNIAASLHDVNKRREIELMSAVGPAGYEGGQVDQEEFLSKKGYSDEIIELTSSVGSASLLDFLEDPKAEKLKIKDDIPISKLIMHYVDDITRHNEVVHLKERVNYLLTVPEYQEINEAGRADFNGRTAFEVQFEVSRQIEEKLAGMLSVEPSESLPDFINGKIKERIFNEKINSKQRFIF